MWGENAYGSTPCTWEVIYTGASYQDCMQSECLTNGKLILATSVIKYPDQKRLKEERVCFDFQFYVTTRRKGMFGKLESGLSHSGSRE